MWSILLTAFIAFTVARAAFGNGKARENWNIIKSYRPIHFITSIPVIGLVLITATLLITQVPFMDKNPILWIFSALFGWGTGNGTGNIMFSGLQWKYYALVFLPVLLFALPSLAKSEEKDFREGTPNWRSGIIRSFIFGLAHLIAMIPLGAAIALSIGGLWFTHQYFKGGVKRSTTYHAVYNSMLVTLLLATVVFR